MTASYPDHDNHNMDDMSDDAGNETIKQKVKEEAQDLKREVGGEVREQAETAQHKVADGADALSEAIDAAASKLDDHDREGMAQYARELSGKLTNAAEQLEGRSLDELTQDAKRLARNNPSLFMLGSIAVGFGLSRFFKASTEREHQDDTSEHPLQRREGDKTGTYAASTAPQSGDRREMI